MNDIAIEQAVYGGQEAGGYQFLARSPGFVDDWLPLAERLCAGFGERPAGVRCPECVFAQPFGKAHVAVVQVADQGQDAVGRPGALAFRLLIVPRDAYLWLIGDPFEVSERFPPSWQTRGELPALSWPAPLPPRRVEQVQEVLKRAEGPTLLGAAQALVDGGRVVFERAEPDTRLLRGLWMLLPTSTRCELWPASFAFNNTLGFDAVVVPRSGDGFTGYVNEEQADFYPEGRYELNLQIAAESGDQDELDSVLARRSRAQTWRIGLWLLGVLLVVVIFNRFTMPPPQSPPKDRPAPAAKQALQLPPAADFPALDDQERDRLMQSLRQLAVQLKLDPLPNASAEDLLASIDRRLDTAKPQPDVAAQMSEGPVQRRLRVLLWKQGVPDYADPRLSPAELVERLQRKIGDPTGRE